MTRAALARPSGAGRCRPLPAPSNATLVTPTRLLVLAAVVGLIAVGVFRRPDPHRTLLPIGSTDLSSVRPQLEALPDSERVLVLEYVRRSGGDVLPPKLADPDEPLTARTFADAIALQRRFRAEHPMVDADGPRRATARE